jgi:hypothetical protein
MYGSGGSGVGVKIGVGVKAGVGTKVDIGISVGVTVGVSTLGTGVRATLFWGVIVITYTPRVPGFSLGVIEWVHLSARKKTITKINSLANNLEINGRYKFLICASLRKSAGQNIFRLGQRHGWPEFRFFPGV